MAKITEDEFKQAIEALHGHSDSVAVFFALWEELKYYRDNDEAVKYAQSHSQKDGESVQDFQDRNKSDETEAEA